MNPTPGIQPIVILTMKVKRKNHQYSDLEARPLKSMYFPKQVLIDSVNVKAFSPVSGRRGCCSGSKVLSIGSFPTIDPVWQGYSFRTERFRGHTVIQVQLLGREAYQGRTRRCT